MLVADCLYKGTLFVTSLFRKLSATRVKMCVALIFQFVYNYTNTYKMKYLFNSKRMSHIILNEYLYIPYKTLYNIIKMKQSIRKSD